MSGSLTHSPANVVRKLLVDLGLGTLPSSNGSWPIYADRIANTPDSAMVVYDTAGRNHGRQMPTGKREEHPGIMIHVRDANSLDGFTKAQAVAIALDQTVNLNGVIIGSSGYIVYAITRTAGLISLGKNTPEDKRNLFTINALVALRQTA